MTGKETSLTIKVLKVPVACLTSILDMSHLQCRPYRGRIIRTTLGLLVPYRSREMAVSAHPTEGGDSEVW